MPEGKSKGTLRFEIAHVLFIDIVGYSARLTDEATGLGGLAQPSRPQF
jgi:hypothetical protein